VVRKSVFGAFFSLNTTTDHLPRQARDGQAREDRDKVSPAGARGLREQWAAGAARRLALLCGGLGALLALLYAVHYHTFGAKTRRFSRATFT
jgi:hypothetical protein